MRRLMLLKKMKTKIGYKSRKNMGTDDSALRRVVLHSKLCEKSSIWKKLLGERSLNESYFTKPQGFGTNLVIPK